ncbi:MAG: hypothetical protein ACLQVX_07670 [Limisphaerales bacterium]
MKPRDIFGLMVRFFGLICLYQGLDKVPSVWATIYPQFPHVRFAVWFACLLMVGWPLAVGIWLVRGAPFLMRLAYGPE